MSNHDGRRAISQKQQRLESLVKRAESVADIQIQSDLACYICVRVSGLLEQSLYDCLLDYTIKHSNGTVASFVERQLDKFQNAKSGKIGDLLGAFDPTWKSEFEVRPEREHIDAVVGLRHQIAHGENTGVTLGTIKSYLASVNLFLAWLITKVGI